MTEERVASYLSQREQWNAIGALKRLLDQAIRDYEHRAIYELLQNAHDAHPQHAIDGKVLIWLAADEGEHGILYIANTGRPFERKNFDAITDVAQSDKKPDEGIGNKGIGFKSVLQLCEIPEIYSRPADGSHSGGYNFRFATVVDVMTTSAVANNEQLAAEVMNDVPHLCLPVPLIGVPEVVQDMLTLGFVTVVRLPIRSASALEEAISQMANVVEGPPPLLFLDRLEQLELRQTGGATPYSKVLGRREVLLYETTNLRLAEVRLDDGATYLLLLRTIGEQDFRAQIQFSVDDGKLSEAWIDWSGDATVAVAVPRSGPPINGRMYTFLPMGKRALAPLAAHINAPFFARLARVDLEESVPLNDYLLDEIAVACAQVALDCAAGRFELAATELCDLICWSDHVERIRRAFEHFGVDFVQAPVVPAIGKHGWSNLQSVFVLNDSERQVVTRREIVAAAEVEFVHPSLDGERSSRLHALAASVADRSLHPAGTDLADWVEAVAANLGRKKFRPELWGRFYDELHGMFANPPELAGRRILVDDEGKVRPCIDSRADSRKAVPFFPPRNDSGEPVNDDQDERNLKLPSRLRGRLFFVNQQITWKTRDEKTWRNRPGRAFLEQGLVNEYRAGELFAVVSRAVTSAGTPAQAAELLRWVMQFYEKKQDPPWNDLKQVPLRVPTADGKWILAPEAFFGRHWSSSPSSIDQVLADFIDLADTDSDAIMGLRSQLIAGPSAWPFRISDQAFAEEFLERIGVRHGLWPHLIPGTDIPLEGRLLQSGEIGHVLPEPSIDRDIWIELQRFQPDRAKRGWTQYRPRHSHCRIPGQLDVTKLSAQARRSFAILVVDGLGKWPTEAFEVEYRRYNDPTDWIKIPTPAAAFLLHAEWVPVSDPNDRQTWRYVSPQQGWTHSEVKEQAPQYLSLVPAQVRRIAAASEIAGSRLKLVGVRYWDDPASAPSRIEELTRLIGTGTLPESGMAAARRDYEEAWVEAVLAGDPFPGGIDLLVVNRRGIPSTWSPTDGEVFLEDSDNAPLLAVLDTLRKPIFRLRGGGRAVVIDYIREKLSSTQLFSTTGVDVIPSGAAVQQALVSADNPWLVQLVVAILDTWRGSFERPKESDIELAGHRLRRATVLTAESFDLRVGSESIGNLDAGINAFVMADDEGSTIVTVPGGALHEGRYERLAHQIAELAGFPFIADSLRLRLIDLSRRGFDDEVPPGLMDIAAAIGESPEAIRHLWTAGNTEAVELLRFLCPFAATFDVEAVRAAWDI